MLNIPEISDEKLEELRKRIKPVARFVRGIDGLHADWNGFLYYICIKGGPRNTTFYFEITAGRKCKNLKPVALIETHHSTGGFFFKPSEAEVLAQIPVELLGIVVAYEITDYDMTNAREHCDSTATLLLYEKRGLMYYLRRLFK